MFTPVSNPSPSQTEKEVERGRTEAANSDAQSSPPAKSVSAWRPAMGTSARAASAAPVIRCPESGGPSKGNAREQVTTTKPATSITVNPPSTVSMVE